jgi:hypothetical protein
MSALIDLTGLRFGRLTVVRRDGRDGQGQTRWWCRCACGQERSVRGYDLRSGQQRTCGCGRREHARKKAS